MPIIILDLSVVTTRFTNRLSPMSTIYNPYFDGDVWKGVADLQQAEGLPIWGHNDTYCHCDHKVCPRGGMTLTKRINLVVKRYEKRKRFVTKTKNFFLIFSFSTY